jgi:hypothetical protein
MDISKAYYVWRIGRSSAKVTEGNIYIVEVGKGFDGNKHWVIKNTDKKGYKFHPTLTENSKMWMLMATIDS